MPAELVNKGPFALLRFPEDWVEVLEEAIDSATHVMRTLRPVEESDLRISLFTRGTPVSLQCTSQLRRLTIAGAHTVFEQAEGAIVTAKQKEQIAGLTEILGTAADNQILNPSNGWQMPCFELHKLSIAAVQDRHCLFVMGRYRDPDNDETTQLFCGYFFDWLLDSVQSQIYEIFVEASHSADFLRGARVLREVLSNAQLQ